MYEIVVTYPLASHGDMRSCHVVNVLYMVISHHKSAWWILMRGSSHESLVERFFPLHLVRCVFSSLLSNKVAGGRDRGEGQKTALASVTVLRPRGTNSSNGSLCKNPRRAIFSFQ